MTPSQIKRTRPYSKQLGITLVEIISALVVSTTVSLGLLNLIQVYARDQSLNAYASYLHIYTTAAGRYLRLYGGEFIQDSTFSNQKTRVINRDTLIKRNLLSVQATNYPFYPCLLEHKENNQLYGLLIILSSLEKSLSPSELGTLATRANFGVIRLSNANELIVEGNNAAWTLALSPVISSASKCGSFSLNTKTVLNQLAYLFSIDIADQGLAPYFYRQNIHTVKSINQMFTDIDANQNDIQSATNVSTNTLHAQERITLHMSTTPPVENTSCSSNGTMMRDSNQVILICNDTRWLRLDSLPKIVRSSATSKDSVSAYCPVSYYPIDGDIGCAQGDTLLKGTFQTLKAGGGGMFHTAVAVGGFGQKLTVHFNQTLEGVSVTETSKLDDKGQTLYGLKLSCRSSSPSSTNSLSLTCLKDIEIDD